MNKERKKSINDFLTFALSNCRLYNPEIAIGDFSDMKGNL
jgi:hypothetical protein